MSQLLQASRSWLYWLLGQQYEQCNCDLYEEEGYEQLSSGMGTVIAILMSLVGLIIGTNLLAHRIDQTGRTPRSQLQLQTQPQPQPLQQPKLSRSKLEQSMPPAPDVWNDVLPLSDAEEQELLQQQKQKQQSSQQQQLNLVERVRGIYHDASSDHEE